MNILTEEDFQKALAYATKKHDGQYRVGGAPYITHPIAVAAILKDRGLDLTYQITGLFHDLLEDTDATYDEILALSNQNVADAVVLLTKEKGYVMEAYVAGIKSNPIAYAVKAADRLHNLQSAFVADEKFRRKYILETIDWYWDFSPEIRNVTKELAKSLSEPVKDYPMLYESTLTLKMEKAD